MDVSGTEHDSKDTRAVNVGVVAASENPDAMHEVVVTGLRTNASPGCRRAGTPSKWVPPAGAEWEALVPLGGAYVIFNSSGSISDPLDRFGFTYLQVTGDAEIVAPCWLLDRPVVRSGKGDGEGIARP